MGFFPCFSYCCFESPEISLWRAHSPNSGPFLKWFSCFWCKLWTFPHHQRRQNWVCGFRKWTVYSKLYCQETSADLTRKTRPSSSKNTIKSHQRWPERLLYSVLLRRGPTQKQTGTHFRRKELCVLICIKGNSLSWKDGGSWNYVPNSWKSLYPLFMVEPEKFFFNWILVQEKPITYFFFNLSTLKARKTWVLMGTLPISQETKQKWRTALQIFLKE